jgi:hypothetical protein
MISLRLTVAAVLVAAAVAGCFTYLVTPLPQVEADQRSPPTSPDMKGPDPGTRTNIGQRLTEEQAKAAFERAVAAILRQAPDLQASAGTNELPIIGHIPLPKSRPIPRR